MRMSYVAYLACRLGEGDVETAFAAPGALQQKLERERGLAGSGGAFEKEQLIGGETALENLV